VIADVGLGSNLGDRAANLQSGIDVLREAGCEVVMCSQVYETAPVGPAQPDYLNAVVRVRTCLDPHALLEIARRAEAAAGRERTTRWGPRTLDVDVLRCFDDAGRPLTVDTADLVVPHPRMSERAFVRVPLSDIDPDAAAGLAQIDTSGVTRTGVELV
jgi:2-amino-4-hydroxy-6-hydroxymethyldihydropteridine diphosphokinase